MKGLTERQNEILKFITKFVEENTCPPTVRETANHFNVSVRAVQDHFTALEKKGYLTKTEKQSRSIRVINYGSQGKIQKIPVLGSIAAGKPIFCDENYESFITLSMSSVQSGANYFALHVRGLSMINAGICDGDMAIIKEQSTAENGDIIVALLDDSVTLKRYFRESVRIRLQPENPDFKPIYTQDIKILGKLSHIIREY